MKKVLSFFLSCALLFISFPVYAKTTEEQKSEIEQKIDTLENSKNTLMNVIEQENTIQSEIGAKIATIHEDIVASEQSITELEDTIAIKKEELKTYESSMKKRIQYLYEDGQQTIVASLFNAKNLSEFVNRLEYAYELSVYDRKELTKYAEIVQAIKTSREQITTETENLKESKVNLEQQYEALKESTQTKQNSLIDFKNQLANEQNSLQSIIEKLSAEERERHQAELAMLEQTLKDNSVKDVLQAETPISQPIIPIQEIPTPEEEKSTEKPKPTPEEPIIEQPEPTPNNSNTIEEKPIVEEDPEPTSEEPITEQPEPQIHSSSFIFPTDNRQVTSGYGYRDLVIAGSDLSFHNGIDFGAGYGEPVYAVADGVVQIATNDLFGGNYIRIQHANGYDTYYGHLSAFNTSVGEYVKQGQIIGYVGSTGIWTTGAHLHFGVYPNGSWTAVDPTGLLPW